MRARDVAVQGVLAAVALVAAFIVWQREPSRAVGEVTVEDVPARSLERIRYEDEAHFTELFRDPQDPETIWVRLGTKPVKPPAEPQGVMKEGLLGRMFRDGGFFPPDSGLLPEPKTDAGATRGTSPGGVTSSSAKEDRNAPGASKGPGSRTAQGPASASDAGAPKGPVGVADASLHPHSHVGPASASDAGAPRSPAGVSDASLHPHSHAGPASASDAGAPRGPAGISDASLHPHSHAGPASASDVGATPPATPPPTRDLRGNELAREQFARFAPLRAQRDLGVLDATKLEEIGLANTERGLTLTADGTPRPFRLAAPVSGWGAPYLLRPSDGRVFLLGPAQLPDLEAAATRLVDRRLHTFDVDGFDRVVISTGTASRAFTATGRPPAPVQLTPVDAPATPDEFARGWHDRVWRLTPVELLGRGETPPALTPAFRVEYLRGDKPVGDLAVSRGPSGAWFARTEYTAGWVRMSGGLDPLAEEALKLSVPAR
jgi:hypothetical protein